MKTRTQIQLEPEQHQRLKELARRERRSLSDLIREIIDGYLAGNQPRSAPGEDAPSWAASPIRAPTWLLITTIICTNEGLRGHVGLLCSGAAKNRYQQLLGVGAQLNTSSYVLVETVALVQRRAGLERARSLPNTVQRNFRVLWVDEELGSVGGAAQATDARSSRQSRLRIYRSGQGWRCVAVTEASPSSTIMELRDTALGVSREPHRRFGRGPRGGLRLSSGAKINGWWCRDKVSSGPVQFAPIDSSTTRLARSEGMLHSRGLSSGLISIASS